jgi:hypothetical protein
MEIQNISGICPDFRVKTSGRKNSDIPFNDLTHTFQPFSRKEVSYALEMKVLRNG